MPTALLEEKRRKLEALLREARGLGREGSTYERHRQRAGHRQRTIALDGRDIGELPAVVNPERKAAASQDFRFFCKTYFPQTFNLPWSEDHLRVIAQIEESVLQGGLFATAMPRGSGKTSLVEEACIWAAAFGHRDFIALIGPDEDLAKRMLSSIKTELECNDLLAEDFPEVVYPIEKLDGIANRCSGQLYRGERTHIVWTTEEIVVATIPDSKASGAIIKVAGLTGGIRGMKHKRADGRTVRPSLVILDDPQTDGSARSPAQCQTRERILAGAVLGLAGPGKKIAGIMPCTVISPGDMADRILDREKHPAWNGMRMKLIYSFPRDEKLWEQYNQIRRESLRSGNAGAEATEFYRNNRRAMDEGACVAWPERFNHDELSAIQHAMNLRCDNERAFFAEYQNEPLPDQDVRTDDLTPDQIATKVNGRDRRSVPIGCNRLTAFIDVQGSLLYYAVAAWEDDFTGYVIDYGTYPDQKRAYFTLRDAKSTLATARRDAGREGQIYAGLEALTESLLSRGWLREDDAELRINRLLIDANWGESTAVVKQFCRQSPHAAILTPSHGKGIGAAGMPMGDWPKQQGDQLGPNWRLRSDKEIRGLRYVTYDTNAWKSFLLARLATAMGDRGCLSLFGTRPDTHRLLADHLTAEFRVRTQGRGREVDEWKIRPERPDNHWFDCLVGCCVAASMIGSALPETAARPARTRTRKTFAEMRAARA